MRSAMLAILGSLLVAGCTSDVLPSADDSQFECEPSVHQATYKLRANGDNLTTPMGFMADGTYTEIGFGHLSGRPTQFMLAANWDAALPTEEAWQFTLWEGPNGQEVARVEGQAPVTGTGVFDHPLPNDSLWLVVTPLPAPGLPVRQAVSIVPTDIAVTLLLVAECPRSA